MCPGPAPTCRQPEPWGCTRSQVGAGAAEGTDAAMAQAGGGERTDPALGPQARQGAVQQVQQQDTPEVRADGLCVPTEAGGPWHAEAGADALSA